MTIKIPNQPRYNPEFDFNRIMQNREKLQLRDYQNKHLSFLLSNHRAGDLSEAGTGKSPTAALWIYAQSQDKRVIWVMPKSLLVKNYFELLLWSNLTPDEVIILDGSISQRAKQLANKTTRVFIMGYQCFANNWKKLVEQFPDTYHLAVDEHHLGFSTHCQYNFHQRKYVGAMRTLEFYQFLKRGGALLSMTGTMISGRLNSAYSFINAVNPSYYPTYEAFMQWHSLRDEYGNPFHWKNHGRLQKILDKHSCRVTFEEVYGKEKKDMFIQMCTMSPSQYKAYKDMENRQISMLGDDYLEADNAAVAIAHCFSIMQTPEKHGLPCHPTDSKEAHLENLLDDHKETGRPLIIFDKAVDNHYKVAEMCKKRGMTHGIMNSRETTDRGVMDYQFTGGQMQIMICSPAVAGIGFNWGHVDDMVFNSLDWQDSTFIQNYRRAMRGVRERPLRIYVFVYRGGLDIYIAKKLKEKSRNRLMVEEGVDVEIIDAILNAV